MIKQIATVAVYVDSQEATKKFWTEQVGFVVKAEHPMGPDSFWLEVGPENAQTNLVVYPKQMMQGWEQKNASMVFIAEDIQATYDKLVANGVTFLEELKEMPWGTFAIFQDLDGNQFVLKGE